MPQWVEDCVESARPQLKRRYPNDTPDRVTSRAYAICSAAYKKRGGKEAINVDSIIEEFGLILGNLDAAELSTQVFYWQSKMKVSTTLTEAMKTLQGEQTLSPIVESILREEAAQDAYTVSPGTYTGVSTSTGLTESAVAKSPHIFISGEAIHAGTTRNMNQYLGPELEKAAPSLVGKPIQLDHSHMTLDNVGKVIAASFDGSTGTLRYVGRLQKSSPVTEKVEIGDMDTVSIGAHAKDIVCGICGTSRIIRSRRDRGCKHAPGGEYDGVTATNVGIGIDFVELSLTPVPADPRASAMAVTHDSLESALFALAESFQYGDGKRVSEEDTQEPEMIEALRETNQKLEADLEAAQLREKQRVANGIAGAEVRLGLLGEKEKEKRLSDLTEKPLEALELLSKSLDMRVEREERETPVSKAKVTDSESQEAGPTYAEIKAFFTRRLFNWDKPSDKAVRTVAEMAMNPESDMHPEYVRFFDIGDGQ